MTLDKLRENIVGSANEMYFEYNGKKSGVDQTITDSIPVYDVWHGDETKRYFDFDEMVNDAFFSGKSIVELLNEVEFFFL